MTDAEVRKKRVEDYMEKKDVGKFKRDPIPYFRPNQKTSVDNLSYGPL